MEKNQALLLVLLVLNQLGRAEILRSQGAVGCSRVENLCRYNEFCNEAKFYPYGKCQRIIFKKSRRHITSKRYNQNSASNSEREDFNGNTKYDMTYFEHDGSTRDIPSNAKNEMNSDMSHVDNDHKNIVYGDQYKHFFNSGFVRSPQEKRMSKNRADKEIFENGKYDMTYFADGSTVDIREPKKVSLDKNHDSLGANVDSLYKNGGGQDLAFEEILHQKRTSKHDAENGWPPIAIPLPIPKEARKLEHRQTRNLELGEQRISGKPDNEVGDTKEDSEAAKKNLPSKNDESLDLDIEIKPLTVSDSKYLNGDITKLSSIPEKPKKETTQTIEHVRTNIVDKSPSKKTKVGVLVAGKLDESKTDIVQNNSPDSTYDKVKDFFKSQQVSSIVDAPLADKKEAVKLYSIPRVLADESNVKRSSIPKPLVHPDGIRLDLKERLNPDRASDLLDVLHDLLWGKHEIEDAFTSVATDKNAVLFHLINNTTTKGLKPLYVVQRINKDKSVKDGIKRAVGVTVLSASLDSKEGEKKEKVKKEDDHNFMVTTLIVAGCVSGILLASICIFIILKRTSQNNQPRWVSKQAGQEAASDYQSLWRQLRQATWESPIQTGSVVHSDDESQRGGPPGYKGMPPKYSWSEEPVDTKMDISTGHVVLSYMEDHLKNENRLSKEWEDLSVYEAEPDRTDVGKDPKNSKKNRYSDVLPYDHNRVKLRDTSNATGSDYINASYIIDDDPRNPAYIAAQGPLASTVADFWQMIWEQGVVVIVMLTKLADLGLPQCHRYWPQKGHEVYHIYEVHLISEHIWCSDYLVRSLYVKHVQTGETRTVTQFHYLSWPHLGIPFSSKPLLDFRRKVLKCFRGHSSPVIVHCSGGIDRTGTYILIDMVLSKMSRGTKEIDIAATLEHLRDQRPQMVKTKAQFEFALASVAEEVNAILQVLTKH